MAESRFSTIDYIVFSVVLVVSFSIGLGYAVAGRKKQTTTDFLFGGKAMHAIPVGLSVLATFVSAISLLGIPSEIYQFGIQYWIVNLSYFFVMPLTAHVYTPVFYNLQLNSMYEYLERRHNRFVRTLVFFFGVFTEIIYVAFVIYAPSLVLAQVTGLHKWICVSIIGVVCTLYTSFGGFKAVIWTDVFQITVIFVSLVAIVIKGIQDAGGISAIWSIAEKGQRTELFNFDLDPTQRHTFWTLTFGGTMTWLTIYATKASLIQRSLSISTLKGAKISIWMNIPGNILNVTLCSLVGLVVYSYYHDCDPLQTKRVKNANQVFPLAVTDNLTIFPGFPGLFVAAIFSATLSTLSSVLNTLATITLEDIVRTFISPNMTEKRATNVAKLLGVFFGIISVLGVLVADQVGGTVLQAALAVNGSIGGPIFGVYTLGMLFPWPNSVGVTAGFVAGLVLSLWICIGAQIYKFPPPRAPTSVAGCMDLSQSSQGINMTMFAPNATITTPVSDGPAIYRLSYMWYSAVGFLVTVLVGLTVSVLTGGPKKKLHPNVFSSYALKIWPARFFSFTKESGECHEVGKVKHQRTSSDKFSVPKSVDSNHLLDYKDNSCKKIPCEQTYL